MNPDQLRQYKREKSRLFNAKMRDLRLKEKKRTTDQQPDNQSNQHPDNQGTAQGNQEDNLQDDNLTLQDVMDIFSTLDTKMDIIQNKLETKMDIIQNKLETIIETKLETKLETNTLLPQFKPIFFA